MIGREVQSECLKESVTKTKCAVHLTLVTTKGVFKNTHSGIVQSEVTLNDLFRP